MAHRLLHPEVANARSTAAARRREALRRPRHEEEAMSNTSDRNEGAAEELGGKIKKGLGQLLGDEQMEAEGRAKELRGKVQRRTPRRRSARRERSRRPPARSRTESASWSTTSRWPPKGRPRSSRERTGRRPISKTSKRARPGAPSGGPAGRAVSGAAPRHERGRPRRRAYRLERAPPSAPRYRRERGRLRRRPAGPAVTPPWPRRRAAGGARAGGCGPSAPRGRRATDCRRSRARAP